MVKGNPKVRNFLIVLIVGGFSVVALSELDTFPQVSGTFDVKFPTLSSFTGLEIISVEQDPVTGKIIGSVVLGKPTITGYGWTGATKSTNCSQATISVGLYYTAWSAGSSSGGCQFGFAEWDTSELPDDFDATDMQLKLKFSTAKFGYPLGGEVGRNCKVGVIEQPFDTIARTDLNRKLFNPDLVAIDGDWCATKGIKTLQFTPATSDAFERAVKGDDKFMLSFTLSTIAKGTGCCYQLDTTFWGTDGSLVIDGNAEPVVCPTGTHQVKFKCVALECSTGFQVSGNQCTAIVCLAGSELDTASNTCKAIQCEVGQKVNLQTNNCETIICQQGTLLIGNDCEQIICNDGFVLSGNECTVIVCPVGNELVGSSCRTIVCPLGTFLQGNNCVDIICPTGTYLHGSDCAQIICNEGELLVGNICKSIECNIGEMLVGNNCVVIECDTGTELIGSECLPIQCASDEELQGNSCVEIPLECPDGTIPNRNICIQTIPTLMATGAPTSILTLAGLSVFIIGIAGLVVRSIKLKGF